MSQAPIKIGLVTDQTGPLSFLGIANANLARLVVDEINAGGGLLGRRIELITEDSATDDNVAAAKAAKLVQGDRVDVIFGGIYSSTRLAIKGPAVVQGKTLYIYPEQYEGEESHPLIFCTGPVPAQQVDSLVPWLMRHTDARKFYLPSADYIWPHVMNKRVRAAVTAHGGAIVGEEYFPVDHADYRSTVDQIMSSGAQVVFNTTVPPGVAPFLQQLYEAGFTKRGGRIVCPYFEENLASLLPSEHVEGIYSCLDYYQAVSDPFSTALLRRYDERFPGSAKFTAGSASTGLYRGLKLWEAAVREAGTLDQAAVIRALDHARIAEGPGGAAEMVPGQHHLRLNMYVGQVSGGQMKVIENLGVIDPCERVQCAQ
jgi:branched-chain amino acid transport system substrate-binding protein